MLVGWVGAEGIQVGQDCLALGLGGDLAVNAQDGPVLVRERRRAPVKLPHRNEGHRHGNGRDGDRS